MAYLVLVCFLSACCKKEAIQLSQEEEARELQVMSERIMEIAGSVDCEDASGWAFTPIGSKPCGGPDSYIAYPTSINTIQFLALVERYRQAKMQFNTNWGLISDCMVAPAPREVVCEEGVPVLVY